MHERERRFDLIARPTGTSLTRRGSVLALGAAIGTALAGPLTAASRKKRKDSCGRRARKKASRACQRQVDACEAKFIELEEPERIPCCGPLATCDFAEFFACLPN